MRPREVLLEFYPVGRVVKVTAVDPATLTEVSIQAPAHLSEDAMSNAAIAKLTYVLRKRAGNGPAPGNGPLIA